MVSEGGLNGLSLQLKKLALKKREREREKEREREREREREKEEQVITTLFSFLRWLKSVLDIWSLICMENQKERQIIARCAKT